MKRHVPFFMLLIFIFSCSTGRIVDDKGELLYEAARKGDYFKLLELINQGADVNYKKQFLSHDEYPLNGAIMCGNLKVVKLLIDHQAKIDTEKDDRGSLNNAIWMSNKEIIKFLLSKGIFVNKSCSSSLIFSALCSVSFEMLKFTVEDLGVCIDSKELLYGDTPLYKTITDERFQETSYLLKKGANVNIQNKEKETPLHRAVLNGNVKMIELVLKNGADITIKDEKGMTPLDYAERNNNAQVVKLLKRYKR
jgi:ankyrin repeat protein